MHRRLGPLDFDLIQLLHEILQIRQQIVDLLLGLLFLVHQSAFRVRRYAGTPFHLGSVSTFQTDLSNQISS